MNLELIKKYEKEFLHMLHGGKLKYFTGKEWLSYSSTEIWTGNNDLKIVIDDVYCTYRKALAEGKTVQCNAREGENDITYTVYGNLWWVDTTEFKYATCFYRIKPEEPEFKVGDWITVNGPTGTFTECISGIADDTYTLSGTNICYKSQASKWEPKEDEVCIFWDNHSAGAFIDKFKYLSNNGKYHTERSFWITCMPFTGILPPHMKD